MFEQSINRWNTFLSRKQDPTDVGFVRLFVKWWGFFYLILIMSLLTELQIIRFGIMHFDVNAGETVRIVQTHGFLAGKRSWKSCHPSRSVSLWITMAIFFAQSMQAVNMPHWMIDKIACTKTGSSAFCFQSKKEKKGSYFDRFLLCIEYEIKSKCAFRNKPFICVDDFFSSLQRICVRLKLSNIPIRNKWMRQTSIT